MATTIILGRDIQEKNNILVTQESLESGTYVLGVQGVGKSSLLLDIMLQQMGVGESVIALDPHGDLVRDTIARMPVARLHDTYLLDLKEARKWPFGLNIFALPPDKLNSPEARDSVRNQVMHAFEKLWPETRTGLYFGNALRPVISTLIENQELTLAHVPRLFYNDSFREHYIRELKNAEAQDFWREYSFWSRSKRERQIDPLLDRIKKLLSDDVIRFILCQKQSKLDLAEVIKQRKNILLRLPLRDPAYEYAAPIIGTFFMTLLQAAIFSFGNMPHAKRPACTLVIDEFQNFVTEENERFFSEGRKYKVKQILAHQYMSQLDRDGLTSMKQSATSAYTIVTFRTNKDDSKTMASLFSGMKRQPTDIYIDVLDRLEKHSDAAVKEFYWHTVKPLEEAAKLREKYHPSYDFGFGSVEFEPVAVPPLLKELNNLFYYAQKEEHIPGDATHEFLEKYGKLVGLLQTIIVDDTKVAEKIRRRKQIIQTRERQKEEQLVRHTRASQAEIDRECRNPHELSQEQIRRFFAQRMQALTREYRLAQAKIRELKKMAEVYRLFDLGDSPRDEDHSRIVTYIDLDGIQRTEMVQVAIQRIQARYPVGPDETTFAGVEKLKRQYQEALSPNATPPSSPWSRKKQQLERKYEHERQQIRDHYEKNIAPYKNSLGALEKQLKKEVQVELPAMKTVKTQFQQVLLALMAEPLAADSGSFSSGEIEDTLQQQPNRQAYVKVASSIFQMNTRDLGEYFIPVSWRDGDERRNRILKQTKDTYCRGRATVEQEIAEVYQVEELEEKKDTDEPPPTAGTPAKLPKQPPNAGREGVRQPQPDIFDRLDSHEPTE